MAVLGRIFVSALAIQAWDGYHDATVMLCTCLLSHQVQLLEYSNMPSVALVPCCHFCGEPDRRPSDPEDTDTSKVRFCFLIGLHSNFHCHLK